MLAAAGVASRRDAESLIAAGKVSVNGAVVTEAGRKVDPLRDHITVEGRPLPRDVEPIYILLYKPKGYVSTREDPHATHTVMDLIRPPLEAKLGRGHAAIEGLHPVGRLDTQTEGVLLLTNDGSFTLAMTHPRYHVPKLYQAQVRGIPTQEELEKLRTGVPLFGRRTLPARVRVARADRSRNTTSLEIELYEGRNQQIRRMLQAVGRPVDNLRRVAIGPVTLQRMKPGQWRFLTPAEVEGLLKLAEAAQSGEDPAPRRPSRRPPPTNPSSRRKPASSGEQAPAPSPPVRKPAAPFKPRRPRPHGPR